MRFLTPFLIAALPMSSFSQTANQATLTLVEEAGFNEVDMSLDVELLGGADDTSNLSGTIEVQLNISPTLGTTDEMTILSADVQGSDVSLASGSFFGGYSLTSENLGFTAMTVRAPGVVNPATGEFDAAQHDVTVNRGVLSGTVTLPPIPPEAIEFDFSDENVSGAAEGTGTVSLTFLRIEGRRMYYGVSFEMPMGLNETIELEGNPLEVRTEIAGTMKATGETFIELEDYATWASGEGLGTTSEEDFGLTPSTPNYMFFALGLDGASAPEEIFEFSENGVTLITGDELALGDLEVQWSSDLQNWEQVPQSAMASGASVISLGDSLADPITVRRDAEWKFFRLAQPTEN